ncbi:MAG: prepilin-type N-terminal cleavage/methylation domain-containing protein [Lentisphaeria bacterium]|nr:prepilin-type N-terminal cleavage/methylation domain-containing protein [Lentisphaeria bacterium]
MAKRCFTLIEVIVVLVIIMLVTGIAVASLRGESPAAALNRTALELEAYLAKVRFLCAESGRDYVVRFYPDKKMFCAHPDYTEDELQDMETEVVDDPLTSKFTFGEDFEVSTVESAEDQAREFDYVEIFRFYPSGGGVCANRPVIRNDNLAKNFDLSFFNGMLIVRDGDGTPEVLP